MNEMLAKLESGEMTLEDEIGFESNSTEHRQLAYEQAFKHAPPPPEIFRGEALDIASVFTRKPDLKRCTFFGGSEICLPAKRYFVR